MFHITNMIPFIWLGVAVLMIIIEGVTMGLTTIWFALSALVCMVLGFFHLPMVWQILIFVSLSLVFIIFTRPVAVKKLKIGKEKSNSEGLVGKIALVVAPITLNEKGNVKIEGKVWSATGTEGQEIAEGARVFVERVEGVTLYVSPEEKQ